jgi:hypothetical protein
MEIGDSQRLTTCLFELGFGLLTGLPDKKSSKPRHKEGKIYKSSLFLKLYYLSKKKRLLMEAS